jgi:hypothetical protein
MLLHRRLESIQSKMQNDERQIFHYLWGTKKFFPPIGARKTKNQSSHMPSYHRHPQTQLTKQIAPVWELIFGCQILVMNFIFGGSKGYSFGIRMSTSKTPPSYGVPSGPFMVPTRCRHPGLDGTLMSSAAQTAMTPDESGLHIAAISLATLPVEAIVFVRRVCLSLLFFLTATTATAYRRRRLLFFATAAAALQDGNFSSPRKKVKMENEK